MVPVCVFSLTCRLDANSDQGTIKSLAEAHKGLIFGEMLQGCVNCKTACEIVDFSMMQSR